MQEFCSQTCYDSACVDHRDYWGNTNCKRFTTARHIYSDGGKCYGCKDCKSPPSYMRHVGETPKTNVSTNATQELTTTLEIDVILVLVRILRQFPHAPVELPLQEFTFAQAKIWIRAHGVDLLAVIIRSPPAAVAITNLETAVTIAQQESIHRVGQLLHVLRARVADTVLQDQVRVVCVLRAHILRRRHQVVQPCRVDTLRLPVGHVLRRRGGRVTCRSRRMQRVPRQATARASARQDIGGAARRLG